ncbi:hypothetical protein [Flavobacterium soli]|uniref:hypothetical protein n=1 Tax=Flavobacterium soli TaxID=344881 RepID=UPI0012F92A6D|nr:hypothetical protein [Flavobacterium soli]
MKKYIKISAYLILAFIVAFIIYVMMFFNSQTDTKILKLEGYVFDESTKKPIERVKVIINNDRYEDDFGNNNHDEYLGHDKIELFTDSNGYYSTSIDKSAFLWIDFYKEGYRNTRENGKYSKEIMSYKTYISKQKY